MGSFRIKHENNMISVISRSFKAFALNERERALFEKKQISYLARPSFDTDKRITYLVPSGKTLEELIIKGITVHRLYKIVAQIVEMSAVCDSNGLYLGNIVFDEKLIFIDDMTDCLFFIYQPLNDKKAGANIYRFIDEILVKIGAHSEECKDVVDKFHAFLSDTDNYTTQAIRKYIKSVYPSIYMEVKEEYSKKENLELDINRTGIGSISASIEYEPVGTNNKIDDGSTTFLGESTMMNESYSDNNDEIDLNLIFVSTDNSVSVPITKKKFVIGKSKEKADGVIEGNSAISRSHCTITVEKEKVYIEDNGSANGTFIDGVRIEKGQKTLLASSSSIRIADEIYYLRGIPDSENKRNTKLILFHSLTRGDDTTQLAYKTATLLSENNNVLLISTKDIPLLQLVSNVNYYKSEDYAIIKSDDNNVFQNIRSKLTTCEGLGIVPVFSKPIANIGIKETYYNNLVKNAYRLQVYDYIVVDMETTLNSDFYRLYELSDTLFEYIGKDRISEYKEKYLREQLVDDSKIVNIGYDVEEKDIVGRVLS